MKKNLSILFLLLLLFACDKKEEPAYAFTDKVWNEPEVLHFPDNLGFYTYKNGYYQFGSDGSYKVTLGNTTSTAKWQWIVAGEKFKVDYEGTQPYNEIFSILSMSDTLLHLIKRLEGEPDTSGNYYELKYRPFITTCEGTLKELDGKKLLSGNYGPIFGTMGTNYTPGEARVTSDFVDKMTISVHSAELDTVLHYTFTCTEVPSAFGHIPVLKIYDTDGAELTRPATLSFPRSFELKFGALDYLFAF